MRFGSRVAACVALAPLWVAAQASPAGFTWQGHDPALCPAWIAPGTAVSLDLASPRASIVVGGMGRQLEALEPGRWRIAAQAEDRPLLEGSVTTLAGRWQADLVLDRCRIQGEGPLPPSGRVASGKPGDHESLVEAGERIADAERLARRGELALARSATQEGCATVSAVLGERHAYALWCSKRLSDRAREGARYEQAVQLARHGAQGLQAIAGERNVSTLAARQAEASALYFQLQFAQALALARDVARLRTELLGAGHPDTLEGRNTIGVSLQQLGRLGEAITELRDLLEATRTVRGEQDRETLRVKNNLALALMANDEATPALRLYEEVLAARSRSLGPRHPDTLNTASNAAYAAYRAGEVERALRMAEEAAPGFAATFGERHAATLRLGRRHATILGALGRYEEAIAQLEAQVALMSATGATSGVELLEARVNLASFEMQAGRPERALAPLQSAVEGYEKAFGPSHPGAVLARDTLGFALLRAGRPREALATFAQDAERDATGRDADSVSRLVRTAGAAQARFEIGERQRALVELEDVLLRKRARFGNDHPETLDTLVTLADLKSRAGDVQGAIDLLEELVSETENDAGGGLSLDEARQASLALRVGENFHQAGYKTLALLQASRDPRRAFEVAELSKSRGLNDALGVGLRLDALPAGQRQHVRSLMARLADVDDRALRLEPGSTARLVQVAERARLKAEIAGLLGGAGATSAIRFDAIPQGTALVSYLVSGDRVLAFVATARGVGRAVDLGTIPGLAQRVEALRRLVAAPEAHQGTTWRLPDGRIRFSIARPQADAVRVTRAEPLIADLSSRLLAPLSASLGAHRRWIIAPDGPLSFVPFELLRWRKGLALEQVEISYIPSLETLGMLEQRREDYAQLPGRREFLGIGIASYADIPGRWPDIASAESEVQAIASAYGSSQVLLGRDASEAALAALQGEGELARFRRVHFATHAFVSGRDARLSAIVLAPAAGSDGLLSAARLGAYQWKADLVVLSACETALGEAATAQGVIGLPYAILASGALASVLSLWSVADESASPFMVSFHGRLKAGEAADPALRATKLEFLRARGPWSAARHWAPYVLYGR